MLARDNVVHLKGCFRETLRKSAIFAMSESAPSDEIGKKLAHGQYLALGAFAS